MSRSTPPRIDKPVTVDGDEWSIMRDMLPYLWPAGHPGLKARVVFSLLALVLAKIVTVAAPYAFKYATDALTGKADVATTAITAIVFFVLAYGFARIMMVVLAQIRDAIFAKVSQRAVKELAVRTFRHLHALSLKFHLERRTGGLSRETAAELDQLVPSVRHTEETEFGSLLPTPTTFDSTNASATMQSSQVKEGSMHSMTLTRMMNKGLLSTPTVSDSRGAYPPTSLDNFPTRRVAMKSIYCQIEEGEKNYHSKDSQLNPRFVAEMMGFPPNWTELPFQNGEQNQ